MGIVKTDRKQMRSDMAFMICDRDKRIVAINSSCIQLLYFDLHKMKLFLQYGRTLDTFDPDHD